MAISSGFFNSKNGDRRYDARQISEMFEGIIADGVFQTIGDCFIVTVNKTDNRCVDIGSGKAWFNRTWIKNDSRFTMTLPAPDITGYRIDSLVFDIDEQSRENKIVFLSGELVSGNALGSMKPPELISDNVLGHHQYRICNIRRQPNQLGINNSDIEIKIGSDECPFITGLFEHASVDLYTQGWEDIFNNKVNEYLDEKESEMDQALNHYISTLSEQDIVGIQQELDQLQSGKMNLNGNNATDMLLPDINISDSEPFLYSRNTDIIKVGLISHMMARLSGKTIEMSQKDKINLPNCCVPNVSDVEALYDSYTGIVPISLLSSYTAGNEMSQMESIMDSMEEDCIYPLESSYYFYKNGVDDINERAKALNSLNYFNVELASNIVNRSNRLYKVVNGTRYHVITQEFGEKPRLYLSFSFDPHNHYRNIWKYVVNNGSPYTFPSDIVNTYFQKNVLYKMAGEVPLSLGGFSPDDPSFPLKPLYDVNIINALMNTNNVTASNYDARTPDGEWLIAGSYSLEGGSYKYTATAMYTGGTFIYKGKKDITGAITNILQVSRLVVEVTYFGKVDYSDNHSNLIRSGRRQVDLLNDEIYSQNQNSYTVCISELEFTPLIDFGKVIGMNDNYDTTSFCLVGNNNNIFYKPTNLYAISETDLIDLTDLFSLYIKSNIDILGNIQYATAAINKRNFVIGNSNLALGSKTGLMVGTGLTSNNENQIVCGKYNKTRNMPFIVGNGLSLHDILEPGGMYIDTHKDAMFVDWFGNMFLRGSVYCRRGVCKGYLVNSINAPAFDLEDGAQYMLILNCRTKSNSAYRSFQQYWVNAPFDPNGIGLTTTALATPIVVNGAQNGTTGVAGFNTNLRESYTVYKPDGTEVTAYHAKLGIGSCTTDCWFQWTWVKVGGSVADFEEEWSEG